MHVYCLHVCNYVCVQLKQIYVQSHVYIYIYVCIYNIFIHAYVKIVSLSLSPSPAPSASLLASELNVAYSCVYVHACMQT